MILVLLPIAVPVDGEHLTPSHITHLLHTSHILIHYTHPHTGTNVGTSVLVFRASDWFEFGWSVIYILPAAGLAFMLGVSEYLLVYHTSGLTLSVAGVLKVCVVCVVWYVCIMYSI